MSLLSHVLIPMIAKDLEAQLPGLSNVIFGHVADALTTYAANKVTQPSKINELGVQTPQSVS